MKLIVGPVHFSLTVRNTAAPFVFVRMIASLTFGVRHRWAVVKVTLLPIDDLDIKMTFAEGGGPDGGRTISPLAEGAAEADSFTSLVFLLVLIEFATLLGGMGVVVTFLFDKL